jgi:hypothetical protein
MAAADSWDTLEAIAQAVATGHFPGVAADKHQRHTDPSASEAWALPVVAMALHSAAAGHAIQVTALAKTTAEGVVAKAHHHHRYFQ